MNPSRAPCDDEGVSSHQDEVMLQLCEVRSLKEASAGENARRDMVAARRKLPARPNILYTIDVTQRIGRAISCKKLALLS